MLCKIHQKLTIYFCLLLTMNTFQKKCKTFNFITHTMQLFKKKSRLDFKNIVPKLISPFPTPNPSPSLSNTYGDFNSRRWIAVDTTEDKRHQLIPQVPHYTLIFWLCQLSSPSSFTQRIHKHRHQIVHLLQCNSWIMFSYHPPGAILDNSIGSKKNKSFEIYNINLKGI